MQRWYRAIGSTTEKPRQLRMLAYSQLVILSVAAAHHLVLCSPTPRVFRVVSEKFCRSWRGQLADRLSCISFSMFSLRSVSEFLRNSSRSELLTGTCLSKSTTSPPLPRTPKSTPSPFRPLSPWPVYSTSSSRNIRESTRPSCKAVV